MNAPNCRPAIVSAVAFSSVAPDTLAKAQKTCPDLAAHLDGKHSKGVVMEEVNFTPKIKLWCNTANGKRAKPLVPADHRLVLKQLYHQLNHPGQREILRKLAEAYYWPTMCKYVAEFVKTCYDCLVGKPAKRPKPPFSPRPVFQPRFSDVQIDIAGPLPPSEGMRYLLTIIDRISR